MPCLASSSIFGEKTLSATLNPFESQDHYETVAYWWCIELAPHLGVEHVLIPLEFVSTLSAPSKNTPVNIPVCVLAQRFMDRFPDWPWSVASESERLAIYLRILAEPAGPYYAVFFPPEVMKRLRAIDLPAEQFAAIAHVDGERVIQGLVERVIDAIKTQDALRRNRSGRFDFVAADQKQGWSLLAEPAPKPIAPIVRLGGQPISSVLPFPVRIIGPINSQSGLGQATRMSIDALHAVGVRLELIDFYLDNPAPRTAFWSDEFNKYDGFAVNILHLNAESIPLAAAYLDKDLFYKSLNIGYFFWELPQAARCHELAVRQLDEIWVSSEFNRQTYAELTSRPVLKTGMAVEPLPDISDVELDGVRRQYGIAVDATAFLLTFDSYSFIKRKNPGAALRAFRRAFPEDENAVLVVKTHNLTKVLGEANVDGLLQEIKMHAEQDQRVIIIDSTLSYKDLISLKATCNAYISLHRSEGWGFGALEAMQLAKPVVATAFSGNLEFCNPQTSFLVPYTPKYLDADDYIFVQPGDYWAEPDVAAAAQAMRSIYENPEAARVVGARGQDFVRSQFSLTAVGSRYLERLRKIAEERELATS